MISHNIFKCSVWGRNDLLNFPLLGLSAAKLQLHFIQESWREPSFHFSIWAARRPLVWFFHETGPAVWSCCSSAWLQRRFSESPPASRTWSPLSQQPKPQQSLALTESTLILCLQLPTALHRLHGKLFWSASEKLICLLCAHDQVFPNTLDLSLRMTCK